MQISDLVGHYNSSVTQSEPMTKTKAVEKLVSPLSDFSAGNVFEGTVSSVKGNQVVLSLANGSQVTARLSAKIALEKGESMFFQVKSNSGNLVEIRPFTVDGNGANFTLLEALKAAGLPTDANNLAMVNKMMEEQMSIDRNSLASMARLVANHSNVNVETLVQLQKLGIPITPEMASQFENYLADKQAIGEALEGFMDELPSVLGNENMSLEQIKNVSGEILSIVTDGLAEDVKVPEQPQGYGAAETELLQKESPNTLGSLLNDNQLLELNELIQRLLPSWKEGGDELPAFMNQGGEAAVAELEAQAEAMLQGEGAAGTEGAIASEAVNQAEITAQADGNIQNSEAGQTGIANQAEVDLTNPELVEEAKNMGYPKEASVVSVLKDIQTILNNSANLDKDSVLKLFDNDSFKALVKDALEQQWLLTPSDLAEGQDNTKKINKLYEQVNKQLDNMEQVVKASGQINGNISELAAEIRSNVEFMNQINEAYTYVQIPLKMAGQNASGELYVYTNKKNLMDKDKELSAFLHLDMDNLGPTDVSVKMLGKDVKTNFYLENDASYDLLERYLPVLEKRLQDKGYSCKITVTNEDKHVNFVEDFMKKDMPSSGRLHRYSFDMRA